MSQNLFYDSHIPEHSTGLTLAEFPALVKTDYANLATYSRDNLRQQLSLQLPFLPPDSRGRIAVGRVDLAYEIIRHDPENGQSSTVVGRAHVPSQAEIGFFTAPSHDPMRIIMAPVSAPLAADVVDKNVATATTSIKALFPNQQPNEYIGPNARARIRSLVAKPYNPERYVWRLASLYLASAWAKANKETLTSSQLNLPTITWLNSVTAYGAVLDNWSGSENPVCVAYEGFPSEVTPLLGVLQLALSGDPAFRVTGNLPLPSVATVWPTIALPHVYYIGPQVTTTIGVGDITPELVWSAASLWCGQHGCMQLLNDYIATLSTLWCSTHKDLSPVYQTKRFGMALPVSDLSSTILMPIGVSYVKWRDEGMLVDPPREEDLFLRGALLGVLMGLGVRTWAYRSGLPYVGLLSGADTERDRVFREFKLASHATGSMFNAQRVLQNLGCTGTLGAILLSLTPAFAHRRDLASWWSLQDDAYQWEEVANVCSSIPRCCALAGLIQPLRATSMPMVNVWYAPDVISSARCVEEAFQGLLYSGGLVAGWVIKDARGGTTATYPVTIIKSYRGAASDWQFAAPYTKDYVHAEMVFKLTSVGATLLATTGPIGMSRAKWYLSRPTVPSDYQLDADWKAGPNAGGGPSGPPPPPPSQPPPEPPGTPPDYSTRASDPPRDPNAPTDDVPPALTTTMGPDTTTAALPHSLKLRVETARAALHDAGQSTDWLESLTLGLQRRTTLSTPWEDRDREGRMRAALDGMQITDPIEMLKAVPNGSRANVATCLAAAYKAAVPCAHSLSAAHVWAVEAGRMSSRARALRACSAMTRVELEDYTTRHAVKNAALSVDDGSIAKALGRGIAAKELIGSAGKRSGDKWTADPVIERKLAAPDAPSDAISSDTEDMIKTSYVDEQIDDEMVIAILGYAPAWLRQSSEVPGTDGDEEQKESDPPDPMDLATTIGSVTARVRGRSLEDMAKHAPADQRLDRRPVKVAVSWDTLNTVAQARARSKIEGGDVEVDGYLVRQDGSVEQISFNARGEAMHARVELITEELDPHITVSSVTAAPEADKHVVTPAGTTVLEEQEAIADIAGSGTQTADFGLHTDITPMLPPMPPPASSTASPTTTTTSQSHGKQSRTPTPKRQSSNAPPSDAQEIHRLVFKEQDDT
ncbi:putative coat protein [Pythium polare RNA virus 2]|uniref:putative coat protein n=1 Tax=Pythium polare RNA virus 2 TaxID=2137354 RepID=UPI000DF02337|nr:putative coat protein [Pythium polare RNA virus 2]BBD50444.1 putative coat protein [Pythium polare RNA virus 2]